MPGIYKIGMTTRTAEERLLEANSSNTWKPPAPYQIELTKKVKDPYKTEQSLHKLLERFCTRIHPRREFFRLTLEDVKLFFNVMEGELWVCRHYTNTISYKHISPVSTSTSTASEPPDEDINLEYLCVDVPATQPDNIFATFAYTGDLMIAPK